MRPHRCIGVDSSVGRASPLQGEGRGFEPLSTHQKFLGNEPHGAVVQLVRIPACHAGGRGFEPRPLRHYLRKPVSAGFFTSRFCGQPMHLVLFARMYQASHTLGVPL